MNLKNMLMNSMGSDSSVEALSKKAGSSKKDTTSFLSSAVPMLLGHLTQNASTQSGASSLANALTQHTDTSSMEQQISNADTNDGSAIIQHILGNDSSQEVDNLSQQTGLGGNQVTSLLSSIAPALLSGISAAASSAQSSSQNASGQNSQAQQSGQQSGGFDFSGLLGMFGGSSSEPENSSGSTGTTLINSLLGMLK